MPLEFLPVDNQSPGGFDNGRVTERRPIMMERRAGAERYGPLFYWAWAVSESGGFIAEHFHRGFEIVSVVLEGTIEHRDSLGTWKSLNAGDVQVMHTNSGVSHSERFAADVHTEMFQIWFEPDLRETTALPPTYTDFPASAFPWKNAGGNRVKPILGEDAPAPLRTDAHLHEVLLQPRGAITFTKHDSHAVIVAISGEGSIAMGEQLVNLSKGDAAVMTMVPGESFRVRAGDAAQFRYAQIVVPVRTMYPLYKF